jgi:hypothetical protein
MAPVRRLLLAFLLANLTTIAACADDPAPGALAPCDTPAGPLVSCPPPGVPAPSPTIEGACARLVECGLFAVNQVDENGNHQGDYTVCVNGLRGDELSADRLRHVLTCVDVSSCEQLATGHCGAFGGNP